MAGSQGGARNRLATETSPYLLQHAGNPVDWHPWGPEALDKARKEGKPILLSIGYSACHWCHVMAHESFEDEATAALMNELFINIKLDREERPDLDKIYQLAHQVLTQRGGGWPLTMFLTPDDQRPFFGGTYFPKQARHGMPAFTDLLKRVADYFHGHAAEITQQTDELIRILHQIDGPTADATVPLTDSPLREARAALEKEFDAQFGGFGEAPKFPHASSIARLLASWRASAKSSAPDLKALYMASLTLTRMAEGGLYDQLGGGFCRYSVDKFWMIPHFEKMLYDNGGLLAVYAQAAAGTGDALYARIAAQTADWALRDMRDAAGGFYAALDADSEGHEGKFYVWDKAEIEQSLTPEEYAAFAPRFGLDRAANFEGQWHLHAFKTIDELTTELGASASVLEARLDQARAKLLAIRSRRIWPGRDDKILTSWNALLIRGLAIAARHLEREDFADAARRAADFIRAKCWENGRLLASYKDGAARFPAYLDDYAFLADALLELLQVRWRSEDAKWLRGLLDALLGHFQDDDAGGFFFTANDHEALIHRSKSFGDEAMPSGNGVAARALLRAGYLFGETRYLDAAERALRAAWPTIMRYPQAHVSMLDALDDYHNPVETVIVRGETGEAHEWALALTKPYAPRRMVFAIPGDATDLPDALAAKKPARMTIAYVCTGMTCSAPVEDVARLADMLG